MAACWGKDLSQDLTVPNVTAIRLSLWQIDAKLSGQMSNLETSEIRVFRDPYREPYPPYKEVRLISCDEFNRKSDDASGWTIIGFLSFLACIITLTIVASGIYYVSVLSAGAAIICVCSLVRRRSNMKIIEQYWLQPRIKKDKE